MSVWVWRLDAMTETPQGEAMLPLPLPEELPDVTQLGEGELRAALKKVFPDLPPESVTQMAERIRALTHGLAREDIIAFYASESETVYFAEIVAPVTFENGAHAVRLRWFAQSAARRAFRKYPALLREGGEVLREVTDAAARTAIRDRLPLPGNRFRAIKWLLTIVLLLQAAMFALRMLKRF